MRSRLFRFFIVVGALLAYTAWKITALWPQSPVQALLLTCGLFALMLLWQFAYRAKPAVYDTLWFSSLAWVGTLTMGLWATFFLISIPFDLLRLIFPFDQSLPHFHIGAFIAAVLFSALGFFQVLRGPVVVRTEIGKVGLPEDLIGLKIAQISDLHIGPTIRGRYVRRVVERTNALDPDLIVITGDLSDGEPDSIEPHLNELKNLKARHGVFYVTGNHEYYWNAEKLLPKLPPLGLTVLNNENRVLKINNAHLMVAGVTDPAGGELLRGHHPDYVKAASSSKTADFKILLAHRPGAFSHALPLGFDVQFSGHTHAGQFFPFSLLIPMAHKYYRGLHQHDGLWVYVNPGTGYWGPAHRFTVPAEITLATLGRK